MPPTLEHGLHGEINVVACLHACRRLPASLLCVQTGARVIDDSAPLKEQAIEAILVRWQYSGLKWEPYGDAAAAASSSSAAAGAGAGAAAPPAPPSGFVDLKGFPGVYVGIREDVLGTIRDTRPAAPRPSKVRAAGSGWCGAGNSSTVGSELMICATHGCLPSLSALPYAAGLPGHAI